MTIPGYEPLPPLKDKSDDELRHLRSERQQRFNHIWERIETDLKRSRDLADRDGMLARHALAKRYCQDLLRILNELLERR